MKKQIKALTEKQYLSGEEAGRLMILDLLAAYKDMESGGKGIGVLTDEEKTNIVTRLTLPDEIQCYNDYRGLHDYLTTAPMILEGYVKTYGLHFWRLYHLLSDMIYAENESIRMRTLPVVMTQKQFDEFKESGMSVPVGGVAVLHIDPAIESRIDENGFYNAPASDFAGTFCAENLLINYGDFISESLIIIKDMLAECLAREKVMNMIASFAKIPQIKTLASPANKKDAEILNKTMSHAIMIVKRNDPDEEKRLKEQLSNILVPIDTTALAPNPAAVKNARRHLNFSVIKNNSESFVASIKREWRNDCR